MPEEVNRPYLASACLLLDAADGIADGEARVADVLSKARSRSDAPVEVFALDAMARNAAARGEVDLARSLLAEADARMADADHFISEADRIDAKFVRAK